MKKVNWFKSISKRVINWLGLMTTLFFKKLLILLWDWFGLSFSGEWTLNNNETHTYYYTYTVHSIKFNCFKLLFNSLFAALWMWLHMPCYNKLHTKWDAVPCLEQQTQNMCCHHAMKWGRQCSHKEKCMFITSWLKIQKHIYLYRHHSKLSPVIITMQYAN
jgi:hypothetical protein